MKIRVLSSSFLSSFVAACLIVTAAGRATASPRAACDVLSLAEVRSLVGAQIVVFDAGSSSPTTRSTVSTCTYVLTDAASHLANGLGAKFALVGPKATLAQATTSTSSGTSRRLA
jgi:hypothetical protein